MTTEQNVLEHLYSKGVLHEDELLNDVDRLLQATMVNQLTENEYIALVRDAFYRLSRDESRSPEVRADWWQLAQAFENQLGVLRED